MFGPSMDNLDALVVSPWGSGEQNMVRFAPAIYASNYLKVTGKQDNTLQEEIKNVLTTGKLTISDLISLPIIYCVVFDIRIDLMSCLFNQNMQVHRECTDM